jgi:DNA-binding CsgD family transcriptional regulator
LRPAIPILLLILILARPCIAQQAEISGRLVLDTTWRREVYISLIPDFNQMYTASDALIIARAPIDTTGYFSVSFDAHKGQALYRLHIIKNGDPASTLIIGGRDENHVFFISDTAGKTGINHLDKAAPFSQSVITGPVAVKELQQFFTVMRQGDSLHGRDGREWLKNKLVSMADSSSSQLVSLLAISYTFGLDAKQKEEINAIVSRLDHHNPYGANIFEQYHQPHNSYLLIIIAVVLLAGGAVFIVRFYRKRAVTKLFTALSQREVTIIKLMADGKSNKEIASELSVELSTVKTHVNNIYAKLKVNGRKDILAYKTTFKKYGL